MIWRRKCLLKNEFDGFLEKNEMRSKRSNEQLKSCMKVCMKVQKHRDLRVPSVKIYNLNKEKLTSTFLHFPTIFQYLIKK